MFERRQQQIALIKYNCENFLVSCHPHNDGYRQWRNFLRQWYIHGPFPFAAVGAVPDWDDVLDTQAVPDERQLTPNLQSIGDPRQMVERGGWMRWETFGEDTGWRYPEQVIVRSMLAQWYEARSENYPQRDLPPVGIHLPIEAYSKDDILMPYWVGPHGQKAHCPRCEKIMQDEPTVCPSCGQRLGGYSSYSAKGWPRKAWGTPEIPWPDDYSFYFLAAHVHVPAEMTDLVLWVGTDCRYKVWLNGSEIGRYGGPARVAHWDRDRFLATGLRVGWNLLLFKLVHETPTVDGTRLFARFALPDEGLVAVNDFAQETVAVESELRIAVSPPVPVGTGRRTPCLRRFSDGTLVCNDRKSTDGGRTWSTCPSLNGPWETDGTQPRPGSVGAADLILGGCEGKCRELSPGRYIGEVCYSADGWRTREVIEATIHIPDGCNLVGEDNNPIGPGIIMGLNVVGLPNGDLLAPMYGSLKQDVVWFDYRVFGGYLKYPQEWANQFKYRSWLLRSGDGGRTWEYLSTIAALPELGDEGFCEPSIALLDNGDLLCVLRNGGGDKGPLWIARSKDQGRTWSVPVRITLTGNYPSLIAMQNGVLACVYGRPNNRVSFDLTGSGLAWSHTVVLANCRGNDHVEAAEIAPGELLCVYEDDEKDRDGWPMATGQRQWYGVRIRTEKLES